MSGLDVGRGGVVSVDPEALRDIARRMDGVAGRYDDATDAVGRAYRVIVDTPGFSEYVDIVALWESGATLAGLRDDCRESVSSTLFMADVYELVELRVRSEMLAASDPITARELGARADRLVAADPRIVERAAVLLAAWHMDRFSGEWESALTSGWFGGLQVLTALTGGMLGVGRIPAGSVLTGRSDPVAVRPVKSSTPAAAPEGFEGALRRMPKTPGAQVAVEKYTYADGRTKYVAYLVGTQGWTMGATKEPWDMRSNLQLYAGERSASYQATLDALRAAGAEPGDEVDVVAHSQSGMVAARLAMESEFDVQVQVTAGSPVEPTLRDDQTLVRLAHTDDPVANLAGGGAPEGSGSADSVRVERDADPDDGLVGPWENTHSFETYIETAVLADASDDPRLRRLDRFWEELGEAATIERTEYRAERVTEG